MLDKQESFTHTSEIRYPAHPAATAVVTLHRNLAVGLDAGHCAHAPLLVSDCASQAGALIQPSDHGQDGDDGAVVVGQVICGVVLLGTSDNHQIMICCVDVM